MNATKIFEEAGIPSDKWDGCFLSPEGLIFTPLVDQDGKMTRSGEEAYELYLQPPLPASLPLDMKCAQMIVDKDLEIIELRRMLTDLDLTVRGGDSSEQSAD